MLGRLLKVESVCSQGDSLICSFRLLIMFRFDGSPVYTKRVPLHNSSHLIFGGRKFPYN